tara:strand:+ start:109639 stop:110295 length:657 start_codon:yes stop_codon:yes gene_type:complete
MISPRITTEICRQNLRPELVNEMQEKEAAGLLNDATDIIPYYFYLATSQKPLSLTSTGLQSNAMIFESAFRSKNPDTQKRQTQEQYNLQYAYKCAYHLIDKGYMPFGSHIKYIGPLNDADSHHRTVGIVMGKLEEVAISGVTIFPQCGVSFGMLAGCHLHMYLNKKISVSGLPENLWTPSKGDLNLRAANDILEQKLFSQQKSIIQKIDDIIGVKTIC